LSIVSRIVEDHEGRIEVTSEPGQGAGFTILLPPAVQLAKVVSEVPGHG